MDSHQFPHPPSKNTTETPSVMRLDYDILLNILPFLRDSEMETWYKQRDMMSLMRTCKTLYTSGMSPYLDTKIIASDFPNTKNIEFICDFFLGHPERIPHLRELSLTSDSIRPDYWQVCGGWTLEVPKPGPDVMERWRPLAGRLAELLSRAGSLRYLAVNSFDLLTQLDEQFLDAVLSLKQIRTLILTYTTGGGWQDLDPISALSRLGGRLEDLELIQVPLYTTLHVVPEVQYPKVRTLHIDMPVRGWDPRDTHLWVLIYWFPNLRVLNLRYSRIYEGIEKIEDHRVRSEQLLSSRNANQWAHLDQLDCSIKTAYGMGLTCTVARWVGAVLTSEVIHMFHTLMSYFCPTLLETTVTAGDIFRSRLEQLFPWSNSVEYLRIKVDMSQSSIGVEDILDAAVIWGSKFPNLRAYNVEIFGNQLRGGTSQTKMKEVGFARYLDGKLIPRIKSLAPHLHRVLLSCQLSMDDLFQSKSRWDWNRHLDATVLDDRDGIRSRDGGRHLRGRPVALREGRVHGNPGMKIPKTLDPAVAERRTTASGKRYKVHVRALSLEGYSSTAAGFFPSSRLGIDVRER